MKSTGILVKTSALILGFTLVLGVGILSLSFSHGGARRNEDTFLTPEHAVAPPTAQELLQKKFDAYNTVTEEDGKRVVTIFSEEQIADIRTRRENGEWFWLSSEEMLYLINDTVKLFETYDVVKVRDLEGNLKKYYGLSFFSSEEYYASFGGFDLGVTDSSFDLKKDVYETILERVRVLNTATAADLENSFAVTDISKKPSSDKINTLISGINPWYTDLTSSNRTFSFQAWFFYSGRITCSAISQETYWLTALDGAEIYPANRFPSSVSMHKYDRQGKVVVIELYEHDSKCLIARVRFDEHRNPQQIHDLQSMLEDFKHDMDSSDNATQKTQYRAIIYFNGFDFSPETPDIGLIYSPDGELNLSRFGSNESQLFTNDFFWQVGCAPIAEYVNAILKEQLAAQ